MWKKKKGSHFLLEINYKNGLFVLLQQSCSAKSKI